MGSMVQLHVSALTDVDVSARDPIGSIRYDQNLVFKYVQFGASSTGQVTAALASGDIACYVVGTAGPGSLLDNMQLVDSANSAVGAGVVQATISASGGPYFGWIQIKGVANLDQTVGGSPSAGNGLTTTSASAKGLTKMAAVTNQYVGVLVDNSTASAPVVNVDFPF
jgi:hypothetical protein